MTHFDLALVCILDVYRGFVRSILSFLINEEVQQSQSAITAQLLMFRLGRLTDHDIHDTMQSMHTDVLHACLTARLRAEKQDD